MDEITSHESGYRLSWLDHVLILAENLKILVVMPLTAVGLALLFSYLSDDTFSATTRLLVPQQQNNLASALAAQVGVLGGPALAAAGVKNQSDIYVAMLKSRSVADALIAKYGLKQRFQVDLDEEARRELATRTRITAGRDGLISVTVDDSDPRGAADIANGYVDALLALTQTLAVTEAGQRRLFFERQLHQSKQDLARAELALRGAGINEATLNTAPQSALEFLAAIKAKATAQEIKVAALRSFMTEHNPEFKQAQHELAALRAQLAKIENNDVTGTNGRGAEYVGRLRDFKYQESLFELMAKQYELARLEEAREGAVVQVVDLAIPPELPSRPRRSLLAFVSALCALIIAIFVVMVAQALRNTAADPAGAEKLRRLKAALLLGDRQRT
jgi:uncharacterized protein involved in exopolysaccharide biosynthesis